MPRFERRAQLNLDAARGEVAIARELELEMRREPSRVYRVGKFAELGADVLEVLPHEPRQHEPIVQLGAPALELAGHIRLLPEARDERAHQELLRERHARVRRHLEGAHLEESQPPSGAVGGIQLVDAELGAVRVAAHVDQQVAEDAVDEPRRALSLRLALELAEGDLDLVDRVVARLVDARRLAGRADEHAGEKERERRDRKSTRLNSSHTVISYAVFCLKKKKKKTT